MHNNAMHHRAAVAVPVWTAPSMHIQISWTYIYVGPADGDVNREESNFISQIGSRSVILN